MSESVIKIPGILLPGGSYSMPKFGFGLWGVGGKRERDEVIDDEANVDAVRYAYRRGITHFDTAELYAAGYGEEMLGRALKDVERKSLFITSKVRGDRQSYADVIAACEATLERLQMYYLDLYLLHWLDPTAPVAEIIAALDELVERGLVRHIGVSNFGVESLKEAQKYARHPIVCNQILHNLQMRKAEYNGITEFCRLNDIIVTAYSPVQKGLLVQNVPQIVTDMCAKYRKTPAQIAINWLISQPGTGAVCTMLSAKHLDENLGAVGWEMEPDDVLRLSQEYPGQKIEYEGQNKKVLA